MLKNLDIINCYSKVQKFIRIGLLFGKQEFVFVDWQ